MSPGERLRNARTRLGLTTRNVEEMSRKVAIEKGNEDFTISHARLIQIENGESTPSIYKLHSLGAIYGCGIAALLSFYVDTSEAVRQHLSLNHASTHIVDFNPGEAERKIGFPVGRSTCGIATALGSAPVPLGLYRAQRLHDVSSSSSGVSRADR